MSESIMADNINLPVHEANNINEQDKQLMFIEHISGSYVLIPSRYCTITQLELKTKNHSDFLKALPYALEDKLTEAVEDLHFVAGDEIAANTRPVVIISHHDAENFLANSKAIFALPDVLALPLKENSWTIVIDNDRCLVRTAEHDGFECPASQLSMQLEMHQNEKGLPAQINLYTQKETELPELTQEVAKLIKPFHLQADVDVWLAANLQAAAQLNLLSGTYARNDDNSNNYLRWLPGLVLFLLAIFIHSGLNWSRNAELEAEKERLNEAAKQLFSESFPDVKRIVNPRVQAEQRLKEMENKLTGANNNQFFELFVDVISTMRSLPGVEANGFNWQQQQLQIQLSAKNVSVVEELEEILVEEGYQAEMVNAVSRDGVFKAQLKIRAENR